MVKARYADVTEDRLNRRLSRAYEISVAIIAEARLNARAALRVEKGLKAKPIKKKYAHDPKSWKCNCAKTFQTLQQLEDHLGKCKFDPASKGQEI